MFSLHRSPGDLKHKKKKSTLVTWHIGQHRFSSSFFVTPIFFLLFFFAAAAFAQAPLHTLLDDITKPQPITQSGVLLPADIQQAIEIQAKEEIIQQKATALVATNTFGGLLNQGQSSGITAETALTTVSPPTDQGRSLLSNILYPFHLFVTASSADKAKLRLSHIDQELQQVQALLQSNVSDAVVDQAVGIIQHIGQETGQIIADRNVQTDREILTLQIEQYTRSQLILQKIEDTLPIEAYLKIDVAREKYLVSGAQQAITTAPNLDVINAIGINETRKLVGSSFAELKAIETLTDISNGLHPQTQQKLARVQKELALQFEKRMLTLPPDVRNRKLQNYLALSYGNPLNQIQAFDQMQHFLTDRDMILTVASLKEIALKKLENRIFEIKTKSTRDQFIALTFNTPQSLEVLAQVQLNASLLTNVAEKKQITDVATDAQAKIIQTLGTPKNLNTFFAPELAETTSLLDTVVVGNLVTVLEKSSNVSSEVKADIQAIQQKILQNFIAGITQNNFLTTPKIAYNPVAENADVRILLPEAQAIPLLEELKNELSISERSVITKAQKAESAIIVDHLLTQVTDSQVFQEEKLLIETTPQIKQVLEANAPQSFFENLDTKEQLVVAQAKQGDQQLYETMQQITQAIFITNNKINEEKWLPQTVQAEVFSLKNSLAQNEIPKLDIPTDVTLSNVAVLPSDVQDALITAAKEKISSATNKKSLDITTEAKELGVSVPVILPNNPLYPLKNIIREIPILLTSDPIQKAEKLLKIDNEKTIEAAKLVIDSQSTSSVNIAIKTLESVKQDFDTLQANIDQVKKVEQTEPAAVDALVNQVINDGIVRQTVIASIENTVHGDAYVAIENIRQGILKDGIDTLLSVTDNNVQKLTSKLENTITSDTSSPVVTVASEIKAIELLTEIARTEPQEAQKILQIGEATIAASLEKTLLSQSAEIRFQEISTIFQEVTGNPVRAFEALEVLKDDFKNPQTILLAEELKDKTAENLKERISEISDANTQNAFADQIIGNTPLDLKAVTQIETEIAPPQNAGVIEVLPAVQKIEDIKAAIEQNIISMYKDKPKELAETDFFTHNPTPDVIDIKVAQDLANALSTSSEVLPEVVAVAKKEETKIIDIFVANVSKQEFQLSVNVPTNISIPAIPASTLNTTTQPSVSVQTHESRLAAETLNPIPETIIELVDLKHQLPLTEQAKIDIAITIEVALIQDHLVNQVIDPSIFQTYVAQITQNPTVDTIVTQVGGQAFQEAVEKKTQTIAQQVLSDQKQLATTVAQIQQEVFLTPVSSPSTVEQSLPQRIQQEIQQIKQEVPSQQIPSINVATETSVSTTITAQPVDTTPLAQPTTSRSEAPAVSQPATLQESVPALVVPAPVVPGL